MNELDQHKAQQELETLKDAATRFYATKAGKHQLKWLADFEERVLEAAIMSVDNDEKIALLNQAKGLRVFKESYLGTLIRKS